MFAILLTLVTAVPLQDTVRARAEAMGTKLTPKISLEIAKAAIKVQHRLGVPVAVTLGLIEVESGYRVAALSKVGCRGLTQLAPATAAWTAKLAGMKRWRIDDPADNVTLGVAYLTYLVKRYGRLADALSAYNKGMGTFERGGRRVNAYSRHVIDRAMNVTTALAAN